jgi:hypothetical protein
MGRGACVGGVGGEKEGVRYSSATESEHGEM